MRELNDAELAATSGGVLPLIGVGLALAGKLMAPGIGSWAIGSASLILATYQAAETYGKLKQ